MSSVIATPPRRQPRWNLAPSTDPDEAAIREGEELLVNVPEPRTQGGIALRLMALERCERKLRQILAAERAAQALADSHLNWGMRS